MSPTAVPILFTIQISGGECHRDIIARMTDDPIATEHDHFDDQLAALDEVAADVREAGRRAIEAVEAATE